MSARPIGLAASRMGGGARSLRLIGLLAVVFVAGVAHADAPFRRFAVVAGANDGGAERVRLRYAESDAASFARVLGELGGVSPGDVLVLDASQASTLEAGLAAAAKTLGQARATGARVELFFYYSGHSDESGLLLGETALPYQRLRKDIDAIPADVRIAILDSCASGALTREKGGVRRAAFQVDDSAKVRGTAFLTSASADEPAQESDRLGASFFTHHLVSGLRGVADASGDGRVTLNEAYQYAFHETLAQTEATAAGAQHPYYDMRLVGSGELVITDLRSTSAVLELPAAMDGRLFVRDGAGRLAAEVDKAPGAPVSLGLVPGSYTVTLDRQGRVTRGSVAVAAGGRTRLDEGTLAQVTVEQTVSRGAEPEWRVYPVNFTLVPPLAVSGLDSTDVEQQFAVNLIAGYTGRLRGVEIGVGANWDIDSVVGAQLAGVFNVSGGPTTGGQASTAVNVSAGPLVGFQGTAGLNLAMDTAVGAQIGSINASGSLVGAQVGFVDVVNGDLTGLQAGVVNVTTGRVRGVQLGLVNYAQHVDAPIGLLSIVADGQIHADVWGSDATPAAVALRVGSQYVYNLFAVATNPIGDDAKWMLGLGIGGHIPLAGEQWFLDIDALGWHITRGNRFNTELDLLAQLRVTAGYRFAPRLAVFAGAQANALASRVADGADWRLGGAWTDTVSGAQVAIWPGFLAGIRL